MMEWLRRMLCRVRPKPVDPAVAYARLRLAHIVARLQTIETEVAEAYDRDSSGARHG